MKAYWNIEQILSLPWEEIADPQTVNQTSGVYMLRNGFTGKVEYIGKSSHIGYRVRHDHPVYDPNRDKLLILRLSTEKERRYYEQRCIELLRPENNHRMGFMPHSVLEAQEDAEYKRIFDK